MATGKSKKSNRKSQGPYQITQGRGKVDLIRVIVAPKSSKNEIGEQVNGRIKVKVTAPAEGGKANNAVIRLIAKWAGVSQKCVSIVSGHKSRRKTLRIERSTA